jgi:hypothetical protein
MYLTKSGLGMKEKGQCRICQNRMESDRIVSYLEEVREKCWMGNTSHICKVLFLEPWFIVADTI